jgi:hypothetical protein
MPSAAGWCGVLLVILMAVPTRGAAAQQAPSSDAAAGVEILVTPYLWIPWTARNVNPASKPLKGGSSTIDPYQLYSHLTWLPFVSALELRTQDFGLALDDIHAPLKAGSARARCYSAAGLAGPRSTSAQQWSSTGASPHRISMPISASACAALGVAGNISLAQGLLPPASVSSGLSWADPLMGLRYHRDLGNGYGATVYGDIGGFGAGAHIDWEEVVTLDQALKPGLTCTPDFAASTSTTAARRPLSISTR